MLLIPHYLLRYGDKQKLVGELNVHWYIYGFRSSDEKHIRRPQKAEIIFLKTIATHVPISILFCMVDSAPTRVVKKSLPWQKGIGAPPGSPSEPVLPPKVVVILKPVGVIPPPPPPTRQVLGGTYRKFAFVVGNRTEFKNPIHIIHSFVFIIFFYTRKPLPARDTGGVLCGAVMPRRLRWAQLLRAERDPYPCMHCENSDSTSACDY